VIGKMKKDVRNWCVILMEDGCKAQVSCVALLLLLNVEVKVGYVMKVGCFLELIFLHFSKT
jgi:hypothetical protein